MAVMVAHVPKVSLQALQRIISLSFASLLLDVGIDISKVPYSCPSAATLKHLVFEESVNTILMQREILKHIPKSLMCDKGDGGKVRDGASFFKLIVYWDKIHKRVRVVSIGIYGAGNTSEEAAAGIDFFLLPFDHDGFRMVFIAQGTDAGGGGTGSSLKLSLC